MKASGVLGGGRSVKNDGYIITVFRSGVDGLPTMKVKKLQ